MALHIKFENDFDSLTATKDFEFAIHCRYWLETPHKHLRRLYKTTAETQAIRWQTCIMGNIDWKPGASIRLKNNETRTKIFAAHQQATYLRT